MKRILLTQAVILLSFFFITPSFSQSSDVLIKAYDFLLREYGLGREAIGALQVRDRHISDHNQAEHVYLVQTYNGFEIFGTNINIVILPDGKVYGNSHKLTLMADVKVTARQPKITAPQAIGFAAGNLGITSRAVPVQVRLTPQGFPVYSKEDISLQDIPVQLGYLHNANGQYELAYKMQIDSKNRGELYQSYINASSGSHIRNEVLTLHCSFEDNYLSHEEHCTDHAQVTPAAPQKLLAQPPVRAAGQYRVLPFGVESPSHGAFELITGFDDLIASPFGWHDADGADGAEYTYTRGNNVHAFLDRDWSYSPDQNIDGGASLIFDYPFDDATEPSANQNVAVTNLFFWNNIMHDFSYRYGFTEAAGNFQENNYSNQGSDNDYVNAHSQFGDIDPPACGIEANNNVECLNNADFSTPTDGFNGRMRMFTWNRSSGNKLLDILQPAEVSGKIETGTAQFGPNISTVPVTGDVIIADDGTTDGTYACNSLEDQPNIEGKIVIIDRGVCFFSEKVYNAQLGGAIGAIICNFEETVIQMGGETNAELVTIPSVFISKGDCERIRVAAANGLRASLVAPPATGGPDRRDGSIDNSIIAHEYGHGISNRLTGGAGSGGCLSAEESSSMGEGWSDFFALVTTVKSGDTGAKKRGIGTYASKENVDGRGIRTYPYSTDMTINPHTFDDILLEGVPHGVGSVWTAMLWDLYWAFSDEYGFDPDLFGGTGGNNMAVQLVMDGLKLQKCNPGFIDARNAILLADTINYGGANACLIWEVFSNRGLGWNAFGGEADSRADGIEGFESLPTCIKELKLTKAMTKEIIAGESITVTLHAVNHTGGTLTNVVLTDPLPDGTTYLAGSANIEPTVGTDLVWTIDEMANGEEIEIAYLLQSDAEKHSVRVLFDDMEGEPIDRWDIFLGEGNSDNAWDTQDAIVRSGELAWYVGDVSVASQHFLQNLEPYNISGQFPVYRFYHYYNTQTGVDGGFLEISTNGGDSWQPLGTNIFRNGYSRRLNYDTFVLPNLYAYSGNSSETLTMTPSYIDLSDYIGESVIIRYRFGTDATIGGDGWYVDDVEIMEAVLYNSQACIDSDETGQVCAEAPERGTIVDSQISSSTDDQGDPAALTLQPNPAGDFMEVVLSSATSQEANIFVYNLTGHLIYSSKWNLAEGINQQIIPTSRFSSGMYIVNIKTDAAIWSRKFVKE